MNFLTLDTHDADTQGYTGTIEVDAFEVVGTEQPEVFLETTCLEFNGRKNRICLNMSLDEAIALHDGLRRAIDLYTENEEN